MKRYLFLAMYILLLTTCSQPDANSIIINKEEEQLPELKLQVDTFDQILKDIVNFNDENERCIYQLFCYSRDTNGVCFVLDFKRNIKAIIDAPPPSAFIRIGAEKILFYPGTEEILSPKPFDSLAILQLYPTKDFKRMEADFKENVTLLPGSKIVDHWQSKICFSFKDSSVILERGNFDSSGKTIKTNIRMVQD